MSIVEGGVIGVPTDVPVMGDVGFRRPSGREPLRDDEPRAGVTDGEGGGKVGTLRDDDVVCVCHISNITQYRGNTSPHPNRYNWTRLDQGYNPCPAFYHAVLGIKNPASKGGEIP
jgi:hypothetical protein